MKGLKKKKKELEDNKKNVGERINNWLELSISTFNFACYARVHFKNAKTLQEKKEILAAVGSNFILKDKLVSLSVLKPFISIKGAKKETDQLVAKFEPSEKVDVVSQLIQLYPRIYVCCWTWIRTKMNGFRVRYPTIR